VIANTLEGYMGFEEEIRAAVDAVRAEKLERKRNEPHYARRRRHPRFHMTTTVRLCPRQRAKKYKA
jgi:hypothetical protein